MRYVTSVERLATERGRKQGIQQGIEQGIEQGEIKGKLEGEALVIERLLTKRFGPLPDSARARLHTATTDQLESWVDRVLDAPSLDAVFGDH
ncbi:DUF4351 domain-containing protein [Propionivibrio sp.]|uniref:DUF4351 domain-containing protein n=1 Tax=Propionivibrio sp. TaxID=2212460 RepID=UPI003BF03B84